MKFTWSNTALKRLANKTKENRRNKKILRLKILILNPSSSSDLEISSPKTKTKSRSSISTKEICTWFFKTLKKSRKKAVSKICKKSQKLSLSRKNKASLFISIWVDLIQTLKVFSKLMKKSDKKSLISRKSIRKGEWIWLVHHKKLNERENCKPTNNKNSRKSTI